HNEGGTNTKAAEATINEVQLIGRGIRYYPFKYEDKSPLRRKFDEDLNHELRVLEEFYYHSDNENRYISELKKELKNRGYLDDTRKIKQFSIKSSFKESEFYNNVNLFINERRSNPLSQRFNLDKLK